MGPVGIRHPLIFPPIFQDGNKPSATFTRDPWSFRRATVRWIVPSKWDPFGKGTGLFTGRCPLGGSRIGGRTSSWAGEPTPWGEDDSAINNWPWMHVALLHLWLR